MSTMRRHARGWAAVALPLLIACESDRAANANGGRAWAGKGGGTATLAVTSTTPPQAPIDTTIDVNVLGTGFTTGAAATWSLAGDTTRVHVQSTRFVNSGQLVARVAIPVTAPIATYDVVVILKDGKKGVGAELFAVTQKDPSAQLLIPLADAALGVRSDRQSASGGYSVYANGVCGLSAKIFATTQLSNTGDFVLQINGSGSGRNHCSRGVTIAYGDGVVQSVAADINVQQIENSTYAIPVGATVTRGMNLADGRCGGLRWKAKLNDGTITNADSVLVTRTNDSTWVVRTQPAPNDRAYCPTTGTTFHIPVDLTIVANRRLP